MRVLMAGAAFLAAQALAQPRFDFDATPGQLAKDVVPSEYRLALDLDPAKEAFTGVVEIALKVRRPTESIVLNASKLTASEISLIGPGSARSMTATDDNTKRQWRIGDDRTIEVGEYRLRITYSGTVQKAGEGLFMVPYMVDGSPARMLATQLEPISARTVFPGFDEPSFRAVFAITITAPTAYEVVSNMPVKTSEPQGNTTRWQFAPTPPMPTYLFAVSVGQFDALEDSVDGIPLRILTAKGKKEEALYAMEVTKKVLTYYREYFGVPFELPKLDQIAVPGVREGAMEDWGFISYNESNLLYNPANSSIDTKQGVFELVAHEIAHQWFGDLVTAASWDEIWLNEAFATWIGGKATTRFNPAWEIPLNQVLWRQRVMSGDAGPATRAIRSGPVYETAVFDVFDAVTYTKGGAVLEMIENHVGREAFRRGLAAYFRGQRLSSATAGDLWHYLSQASGTDVAAVARSWTDQKGYPLLQARVTCSRGGQTLKLEQQRFSVDGREDKTSRWQVPFAVSAGSAASRGLLLSERSQPFAIGPCTDSPLLVDSSAGFFRVQYSPEHLHRLAKTFSKLPPSARLALLTDTYALGQAGRIPLTEYFALLDHLHPARDAATLVLYMQVESALSNLHAAVYGSPAQRALEAYAQRKLAPMLGRLTWTVTSGESAVEQSLRNKLIEALGKFGDLETLRRSKALYAVERSGGAALDPSLRPGILANVGRSADAGVYSDLINRLAAATRVEDGWLYATALSRVEDPALARQFLEVMLGDTVPSQIASWLPGMVAGNLKNREMAYDFVLGNFQVLAGKHSEYTRPFLLSGAASGFNDATRATALIADQKRLLGDAGEKAATEAAAAIELKSRIRVRESASLATSLSRATAGKR
ncbi:MAG: M1 family metallopeptidase [Caldimonas sp.]